MTRMGLLSFLFPPDPSKSWRADPGLALDVDLDVPSFAGLRLGDPAAGIARFGPPENSHATRDGLYDHRSRGFQVDADAGLVDGFLFRWDDRDPVRHFRGRFRRNGAPLPLDASTGEGPVRSALGEPYWIDTDADERVWFYERNGGAQEWQVEFVRGRLTVLSLLARPILADLEQREAYRVTRPWPPL